ncbi:hypothetical protein TNCV_4077051 [Trichonephila clavipes]|nr:hypothetical protein TNCV_4077051 [Trichonephila clavipes]
MPIKNYAIRSAMPLFSTQTRVAYCSRSWTRVWSVMSSSLVPLKTCSVSFSGLGSLVVKVSDCGWLVTSSSPLPIKTRRDPCVIPSDYAKDLHAFLQFVLLTTNPSEEENRDI